ncbi:hypothetical protein AQUCO_02800173v1 [Aquilegia coerulea]|uniref:Uncharacterized protein n=1 Tax=Aquilegia coerulea TaxID=218851 RepID=A0A2G5D480_AQUCA|nr:hypothetical protein AQUCO_02800173v1 [Aquilegia coerulea]
MVSDQEIVNGVESLLRQSTTNPNVAVTSINGVIQQLEAKLGLDLSHKAGFIRDLLLQHHLLQQQHAKDHFALQLHHHHQQHQQQQQQHFPTSSDFTLHPQHHQQQRHHSDEINFRYPLSPQQQQQQHLYPYPHQHQQLQGRIINPSLNLNQPQPPQPQQQQQHLYSSSQGGRSDGSFVSSGGSGGVVGEGGSGPEIKKESAPTGTKRRGGPGGLNKVCGVTPELEAIVGEPAMPRTQIVKQLWAYIRKHNLQDPSNKRKIICNDALRLVFETDCTDMFKMNKLLAKHIRPLDPTKEPGPDSKRLKVETESTPESTEAVPEAGTEAVSGAVSEVVSGAISEVVSGAISEVVSGADNEAGSSTFIISDALARFFGTEEREMTQSEAVRRIWEYIKANQLEVGYWLIFL